MATDDAALFSNVIWHDSDGVVLFYPRDLGVLQIVLHYFTQLSLSTTHDTALFYPFEVDRSACCCFCPQLCGTGFFLLREAFN